MKDVVRLSYVSPELGVDGVMAKKWGRREILD